MRRWIMAVVALALLAGPGLVRTGAAGESPIIGKAAQVNPYNGMQQPEKVYEFAAKPAVKKEGDVWTITFTSKAACDATVAIVGKDGKIVRHLASGVLGKNAPWPFQQNSLSQKLEWDGLKDDFTKAEAAGCTVRVSLGLRPEFERSLLWDPNDLYGYSADPKQEFGSDFITAQGEGGSVYVIDAGPKPGPHGRVYDKDGKYLRTFFPPPAAEMEKLMAAQGYKLATTVWGDKTAIGGDTGFCTGCKKDNRKMPLMEKFPDAMAALKAQPGVGEAKVGPRPEVIPPSAIPVVQDGRFNRSLTDSILFDKCVRLAAERSGDDLYAGWYRQGLFRLNGATGELDPAWFPKGELKKTTEVCVGPDGLVYMRVGPLGYGPWLIRTDRSGKPVAFGGAAMAVPQKTWPDDKKTFGPYAGERLYGDSHVPSPFGKEPLLGIWSGETNHSPTHSRGLHAAPNGMIVMPILHVGALRSNYAKGGPREWSEYLLKNHVPNVTESPFGTFGFVAVADRDGNYYSANAVADTMDGHCAFMDRDGNIYSAVGGKWNNNERPYGLTDTSFADWKDGHASLAKFQWKGAFPLSALDYSKIERGKSRILKDRPEILWRFDGMSAWTGGPCTCHNTRSDMDFWGRAYVITNHLCSVMVLDANGNAIARIGRYGNVDDADPAFGKIHFAWVRAVTVSDTTLYAADQPNRRIVRAALKYAAEEAVPLP